jgi:MoxR-like ATPase
MVATMNDDASTFELPEYIHSRLQPQIFIDFPEREEEKAILRENLPFADEEILEYVSHLLPHPEMPVKAVLPVLHLAPGRSARA